MARQGSVRVELYDSRKSTLIPAHESELSQIALNLDGTRWVVLSARTPSHPSLLSP